MKRYLILLLLVSVFHNHAIADVKEINPTPVLTIKGLGNGYSAPAITSDRILITGEIEDTGYLFAFDFTGNLLWKADYGKEWMVSYRGSRATPTVIDTLVYTCSGMGDIACFNIKTGKKVWSNNMVRDLNGMNAVYGYSIPVIIEKERIYCQPGGPDTNIVCLNRHTGKIIWVSAGNGETPGFAAPLFIRHHNRNLFVTYSELALLGLDADSGEFLWISELSLKGQVPCNKPIYSEGFLYVVAGHGNGAVKFEISEDGSRITKIWNNIEFDTYFGGFVLINNFIYGSSESKRSWISLDAGTGKTTGSLPFRTGTTVSAKDHLVLYNYDGIVGIAQIDQGQMKLVNSFKITQGTNDHFSHPVVTGGKLFIRHGDTLLVYDYEKFNPSQEDTNK
ncbi:MAG: PQQ-binding-like beta-propeller repeat protein [Bacteroidales bacterium]|jgi:outer membrane protein assembly factor BamB|nr:PQQ-binding-like beta-propeller repeat protein [Bacteroidales bacterium]